MFGALRDNGAGERTRRANGGQAMNKPTVAAQLIIFGKRAREDLAGVLDDVAKAGYQAVETGLLADQVSGGDFRRMLQDRGLRHVGTHFAWQDMSQLGPIINWMEETGGTDVILSDLQTCELSADLYKRKADLYNAAGRRLRQSNLTLSYHNHAWELGRIGDRVALELLYEQTDPSAMQACVDTYWVNDGGEDAAQFIHKHASRLRILHAKDSSNPERGHRSFCPVGAGVLDMPAIFRAAGESRAPWVVVEEDVPRPGTNAHDECAISRKYIREKFGL
jgi:sugar phosphate isomerase/epimerase